MRLPDRPFLYSEAASFGLTRRKLRTAVQAGQVRHLLRGVYCASPLPDSVEIRALAASLVVPEHAVVCDHAAAWLHEVDCYPPAAHELVPAIDVVALGGHDRSRRDGLLGGKRDLAADEVMTVHGVRVTIPVRTAADLACRRGRASAMAVLDAFMRRHGVTAEDYQATLRRFAGRRGVTQFRELVAYADPDCESPGESWTKLAIIDAGLPRPTPQVWVLLPELGPVRVDFAYPWLKIAVEYDGAEHHSSDEDQEADQRRRRALRDAGWIVIVVRKDGFTGPPMDAWLTELRDALAQRSPSPRRTYARAPRERRRR